jgi:predicted RNA-binding Zn-ribbon protein involved in translation (DUF1610 family)
LLVLIKEWQSKENRYWKGERHGGMSAPVSTLRHGSREGVFYFAAERKTEVEEEAMKFKCPSCGSDLCEFVTLWATAPLKKYRCPQCGDRFKGEKTGCIKYSSYAVGLALGALVVLVLHRLLPVWALAAAIPIFAIDYWVDMRNMKRFALSKMVSTKSLDAAGGKAVKV